MPYKVSTFKDSTAVATPTSVNTEVPKVEKIITPEVLEPIKTEIKETIVNPKIEKSDETKVTPEGKLETKENVKDSVKEPENNESDFTIPDYGDEPKPSENGQVHTPESTNWKESIKGIDKKELAKYLGISDFALEMDDHISKGGSPEDYLNAKAIDWNKVDDADLILSEMKKEFPDATNTQLQRLFNKKYNQTDIAEDEDKEDGLLLMKSDARKVRNSKIAEQQNFKIPENKVQQPQIPQITKADIDAQKKEILKKNLENETIKNLIQSKRVAIPLGENESFNFNIDKPEFLVKVISDGDLFRKVLSDKQGEPDMAKLMRLAKYAIDMDGHDKTIFNYGQQRGHLKEVEEGRYAAKPSAKPKTSDKETLEDKWKAPKKSTYGTSV